METCRRWSFWSQGLKIICNLSCLMYCRDPWTVPLPRAAALGLGSAERVQVPLMAGLSQTAPFSSFLCSSFTVWAPLRAPSWLCGGFCPCPGAGESCHTPKVILPVQGWQQHGLDRFTIPF